MTKCLAVALSMTLVGSAATIIFFAAAKPTVWNGWHAFDVTISHPPYVTNPGYATPGEVCTCTQPGNAGHLIFTESMCMQLAVQHMQATPSG